ncbi:MAG TPA: YbjN domain-containing protein [Hyphomonadaceae bacterium]|nr:YbjN domain-containing protein [Hyphomonadaceae bacterium]
MLTRMWARAAVALALACVAASPSLAQPGKQATKQALKHTDQVDLIDRYDGPVLRSIISELGYTISDSDVDSQGRPRMTIEVGGDSSAAFRIVGQSCEGKDKDQVCQGIQLAAQFGKNGDDEKLGDLVDRVNRTLRPAKIFWIDSGLAYERYLIMDGGVSRENLKTNIEVFVEILQAIWDQI